jgi:hypothetical protein
VCSFDVSSAVCSFHAPLHRALSKLAERLSTCGVQGTLYTISNVLSSVEPSADGRHAYLSLVEIPVRTIVMAAQIRQKMWVRNGESVSNELFNYSQTPQCLSFYDADLKCIMVGALLFV